MSRIISYNQREGIEDVFNLLKHRDIFPTSSKQEASTRNKLLHIEKVAMGQLSNRLSESRNENKRLWSQVQ
jgi:hypothetical protein